VVERRTFLTGLTGAAALSAVPSLSRSSPRATRKAKALKPGDTLGLVAPAGFVGDRFGVDEIADAVRAMGLVPKPAPHLTTREGYLAGDDRTRAADLQAMFEDESVAAIMAVRGGWGCARILPYLDFARIARHPKLFVGFSDNTALHLAFAARGGWGCARILPYLDFARIARHPKLFVGFSDNTALHLAFAARCGFPTLHAPNASASWPQASWDAFYALAFEGATPTITVPNGAGGGLGRTAGRVRTFRAGTASGRLLGGNLTVLSALVGTPYLPDFTGAILFLEDTNEAEYRIDRMLTQLALAGVLGKVAGIAFGQCTDCEEQAPGYGNFTIYEVLDRAFAGLGVPAFQGLPFGHIATQASMPEGVMAEIDAGAGTLRILEPVVVAASA